VRVSGSIANLINGVSQQPAALRLPTQGESQVNCFSTVVEGLKNRPPAQHVAKLASSLVSSAYVHTINRDNNEQYIVSITNGDLKVHDFDGDEKTVAFPDGKDYLTNTDPKNGFSAVTVADFTFIANRATSCAMDSGVTSTARPYEALVNVKIGNFGRTYKIMIDGTEEASYSTPTGANAADSPDLDTVNIATELYNDLDSGGFNSGNWTTTRYGNAIHIQNSSTDFAIATEDGFNKNAMVEAKDHVQEFTNLPNYGPNGFVIEVTGDDTTNFDNYWVKFMKTDDDDGSGVWKETVQPGIVVGIDAATMPHSLVRESDGTFTFQEDTWDDRLVGDVDTAPDPSFIGESITDLFFSKNRLGFIADENVIMSRSGDFYNFWPTTVTTVRDDDPIDVSVSHTKVSILKHAIPYKDWVLLFSTQTQFRLKGSDLLTPETASIDILSEYDASTTLKPIIAEQSVFFALERGSYSGVVEYFYDDATESVSDSEVTSHVPTYIPEGLFKLTASGVEDLLIGISDQDLDALYVYKYFRNENREKLQSSWSKWEFPGVTRIYDAEFIASDLFMVVERDDGVFLEKVSCEPGLVETGQEYTVHLDRKIESDHTDVSVAYDAGDDETTYTLPYTEDDETLVVVVRDGDDTYPAGYEMPVLSHATDTVVLAGDTTDIEVFIGIEYECSYEFSTFLPRREASGGGFLVETDVRLQLQKLLIQYDSSSYFEVEVNLTGRDANTYLFNGRVIGSSRNTADTIAIDSGTFSVPILSKAERAVVTVKTSKWLPFALLSAEWVGRFIKKSRPI